MQCSNFKFIVLSATTTKPTITGEVWIRSTTYETVTSEPSSPTLGSDSSTNTNSTRSKYNTSDKIALGVGIGFGIPTLIATVWMCFIHTSRSIRG
jgi:hypothetical protein